LTSRCNSGSWTQNYRSEFHADANRIFMARYDRRNRRFRGGETPIPTGGLSSWHSGSIKLSFAPPLVKERVPLLFAKHEEARRIVLGKKVYPAAPDGHAFVGKNGPAIRGFNVDAAEQVE